MPEYLETMEDKFTFRVATDRRYTSQGVWVLAEAGGRVRMGLSDFPQQNNGDVAFANVKPVGTRLATGDQFAEIETIKAMVELHAPITGTIAEVNAALDTAPESINQSPYEKGWLAIIESTAWDAEQQKLLDAAAYFSVMKEQVQEALKKL